ncbi:hypothetical protein Tco_1311932 [Tanacetum coccineum]
MIYGIEDRHHVPSDAMRNPSQPFKFLSKDMLRTELMTPDLTCPSTYQLLRSSLGCSRPNMSFDMPASPEYLSSLACASLAGIEPTMTLFRVFRTLCKQGDWFSFAKRRASSPVCINDNRSCMKHCKSGFFMIDQRAIPDYMTWRHPNSEIDDPKYVDGSYRMADVRLLRCANGNVMGIHNFLCLTEWTGAEVQEEPHHDIRPTLQRLPFYCTHVAAVDDVVPDPTPEELDVSNPSAKVIAKAEASHKRKVFTSDSASSHVAKRTRSSVAQSSGSTTRPNLFADDSGAESDDDACYDIPIVIPTRFIDVIPPAGNQSGGSAAPADEGPNTQGSRGKGIMTDVDAAVVPSVGASRPRVSSGPAPSFRELPGDAIHRDFFPFSSGPYYATYPEGGIAENCEFICEEWDAPHQPTLKVLTKEVFKDPFICKTVVDQFLTPGEMARIEALSFDQLTAKMSVLHCLMMSHGGELLAQYRGLLLSHHSFLLLMPRFLIPKTRERRGKKIKSVTKSLDNLHAEVARLSIDLNRATVLEAEKDEEILRLKATPLAFASFSRGQFQALVRKFLASDEFGRVQVELLSLAASDGFERGLSIHRTKEEFVVVLKKISQFVPGAHDRLAEASYCEMVDVAANAKPGDMFVHGISHVVDDVTELTVTGSECASSGPGDVVVALSAREKDDGSVPSSTIEEVVAPPYKA